MSNTGATWGSRPGPSMRSKPSRWPPHWSTANGRWVRCTFPLTVPPTQPPLRTRWLTRLRWAGPVSGGTRPCRCWRATEAGLSVSAWARRPELLRADHVVVATGIWGPVLAADAGVRLPMVDVQHPYLFTAEVEGLDDTPIDTPIVRYLDQAVYTRRHGRRYGLGTYSHSPLPLTPTSALASAEKSLSGNGLRCRCRRSDLVCSGVPESGPGTSNQRGFRSHSRRTSARRPRYRNVWPVVRGSILGDSRRRCRPTTCEPASGDRQPPRCTGVSCPRSLRRVER